MKSRKINIIQSRPLLTALVAVYVLYLVGCGGNYNANNSQARDHTLATNFPTSNNLAKVTTNRGWVKAEGRESPGKFYARKFGVFEYNGQELRRNSINFVCHQGAAPMFMFDLPEPINEVLWKASQFGKLDTSAPVTLKSANHTVTTYAAFTDDGLVIQRPESDKVLRGIFELIYDGETAPNGFRLSFHSASLPSIVYVGSPDMDFETQNLGFIEEKFGHKLNKLTMEDISAGCGEAIGNNSLRYKLLPEKGMRLWMGTGVRSLDEPHN